MKFQENVNLKALTTFRVGGPARYLISVKTKKELLEAVAFAEAKRLPVFVLGNGSNILVSEKGINAVVIQLGNQDFRVSGDKVRLGGGLSWHWATVKLVDLGLAGVECLSGIPGTVGAAPVQNIGAYGQELADILLSVEAFDTKTKEFVKFDKEGCQFGYRDSVFKKDKGRYIIFSVTLKLKKGGRPTLAYDSLKCYLREKGLNKPTLDEVRKAVIMVRATRFEDPDSLANAGSFFKNPVVSKQLFAVLAKRYPQIPYHPVDGGIKLSAGWLIEKTGWKGKRFGGAAVSKMHALVLTNPGGAKAGEIKALATAIKKGVERKFSVALEEEVQYVGFR